MAGGDVTVGVFGTGPAAAAVEAALADVDAEATRIDETAVGDVDHAVAVSGADEPTLDRVDRAATGPWIAVELGGIGGLPLPDVEAAVSVLDPERGCHACLRRRVRSAEDGDPADDATVSRADARLAGAVAGRLLVSLLDGDDVAGRVVELPYVERRLLPVPGCRCDPGRDRSLRRDEEEVPLEDAVVGAERAVDERLGIVTTVGEVHSFPAPYYLATLCDTDGFSDVTAGTHAAGVATDWNAAFMKAVGEALERYGAGVYRESTFEVAPVSDRTAAVPPSAFVLPEDDPTPGPDEPIPWVPGEDLTTGGAVELPAEFVVFPPPEQRHKPAITTGLGLGTSGIGALLSGLYEVIERDATMLSWYSTFEPLGLSVDDEVFRTLARRARAEDLDVTALLVTQDVDVPVVSVAVHREEEWPRFAVGSGASLDPQRAASAALEEAVQNWIELRDMGPDRADAEETAIGRYADFPPEARAFVDAETWVDAADVGPGEPPTGAAELEAVIDRAAGAGLSVYAARLTPRDVEALGFEAVRVLVPEAQPLFTDERYFGERARRVPRELGFRPRLDRAPHPYP